MLAVCPPWNRPRYEPSKRRLTWPGGAVATTFSAEEPERLRGPQSDCAWIDELAAFRYPAAVDNLLFGLRLGDDPRLCVTTTTPKPVRLVTDLVNDPTTAIARGTTYENRAHLAASFFDRIVTKYEGTRLGQQELLAEILEVSDGAWFSSFDPARHVTAHGRVRPGAAGAPGDRLRGLPARGGGLVPGAGPVAVACRSGWITAGNGSIGAGGAADGRKITSLPPRPAQRAPARDGDGLRRLPRRGPVLGGGGRAILAHGQKLPCAGPLRHGAPRPGEPRPGRGSARRRTPSSNGSSAPRSLARWPTHRVLDGLDQLEVLLDRDCLLIHPRCQALKVGVPELRPASGRRAATGRMSRPTRSTRTRT